MLNVFLFSIAGKKKAEPVDDIIHDLLSQSYVEESDKRVLRHTLEVSEHGMYPSKDFYQERYQPAESIKSLSEIKTFVVRMKDYYAREEVISSTMNLINETNTRKDLIEGLAGLIDVKGTSNDELNNLGPKSYSDIGTRPENSGYMTGIPEVDGATNGFQPGTVFSMCAFVSEGKSTFAVSSSYKNIKMGKKGVLFSLEMHPDIVWMQFLSRFLFEEKSMEVRAEELIQQTLTDERKKLVAQHEDEFREFMKNLIIIDESVLTLKIVTTPRLLSMLFKKIENKLGGLDFTIWDHVNQFELMYPTHGNECIRSLTSANKTYHNQNDIPLISGMCVQTNREGWKRARKSEGKYAINAISDLNEIERSCTYVMFFYTSEDMRLSQETKVTLAKNRLGSLLPEPIVTTFNPAVMVVGDLIERIEYNDSFGTLNAGGFDDVDEF